MKVPDSLNAALRASALVTQMALQVVVGAALGNWLDGWLNTSPVLVLALGGVGFATGMFVVWRAFAKAQSDDTDADNTDQSDDTPPDSTPR